MKNVNVLVILLTALFMIMQAPFLLADPDINIANSRDANTDEGLNSCQVRNLINHDDLTFYHSDNFIKTPLFGAILFIPYKIFGTLFLTGRLTILLVSLVLFTWIFTRNKRYALFGIVVFIILFNQYYIFHYFHYCMAEMLSSVAIFFSAYLALKPYRNNQQVKAALYSSTFITLSYFIKIQFAYAIFILPMAILIFWVFKIDNRENLVKQLAYTIFFITLYFVIYYVFWYLPDKTFYDYILTDQTTNRFADSKYLLNQLNNNFFYVFTNSYLKWFTYSFYFLFPFGVFLSFQNGSRIYKMVFITLTCWILCEFHKLFMTYLPTRYLISMMIAMGLLMATVIAEMFLHQHKNLNTTMLRTMALVFLCGIGITNGIDYYDSYQRRSFTILQIDNYLAQYNFDDKPILGAWAPSLCWRSKALTIPVWNNYFNDTAIFKNKPAIIISELDEDDSNKAYLSKGIQIDEYADSIKYFTINHWKIKLLWIRQ